MDVEVNYLIHKQRGGIAKRTEQRSGATIRLGRGTQNEVYLPDPRVPLEAATIEPRQGGYFIEAAGTAELRVKDAPTRSALLAVGDKFAIGPYDLELVAAEAEGHDIGVNVVLARPLGDDLARLQANSRTSLAATRLSKRAMAWLFFLAIFAGFLGVPVASYFMPAGAPGNHGRIWDTAWVSGEISSPHKFIGEKCDTCHQQAFVMVQDNTCTSCHTSLHNHADPKLFQLAALTETRCATCHKEHEGPQPVTLNRQEFCADCHADFGNKAPASKLLPVGDFAKAHPQFQASVVTDPAGPAVQRAALPELPPADVMQQIKAAASIDAKRDLWQEAVAAGGVPMPQENSGLKFPHDKHLTAGGVRSPTGKVEMQCTTCHVTEAGGELIRPISMERDCASCHRLHFDPAVPNRTVPHGKPDEVQDMLRDFYAGVALKGGYADPTAPAIVRRRPGTELQEAERQEALAWAEGRAQSAIDAVMGKSICGSCHTVTQDEASRAWTVAPVRVAQRWLPKGGFHHASHDTVACQSCHLAEISNTSADVLLPGIGTCQTCHGSEASVDKVPSPCVTCHIYHRPDMPPQHASGATAWAPPDADAMKLAARPHP